MSAGYRFKRDDALPRAAALIEALRPACAQIEIAGSLRRGKATVGDIEIVARPLVEERPVAGQLGLFGDGQPATVERVSLLDPLLERLAAAGEIHQARPFTHEKGAWGEKYKKFWTALDGGVIQVDLFLVNAENWGAILMIRTGPSDFSRAVVDQFRRDKKYRQQGGYLISQSSGQIVPVPKERDYFRYLGIAYIPPEQRNLPLLRQMLAQSIRTARDREGN